MKPKMLKIFGLNSFENEQKIDFDKLTERGLFGIFGPTGSGKSTILDAITIALYGKITRTTNGYINTVTKDLKVSYEFEIGIGNERRGYIAERNIKVNKKGGYNTKYARLIEKTEKGESIIAEGPSELQEQIEKIIGLTVEDFTRSVVLPQGRFSDFLKLKGRDKRNMLERIFALEKYGQVLGDKIKKVRNINLKKKDILFGELKKFENLSEEDFKEKKEKLKKLKDEEKKLIDDKKDLDCNYEVYKQIWDLQQELGEFESRQELLKKKTIYIDDKKEIYEKGKRASLVNAYIIEFEKINEELSNNLNVIKNTNIKLKKTDENVKIAEDNYNFILKEKEEIIPKLIKEEGNYTRAIEIDKKIKVIEPEIEKLKNEYSDFDYKKKVLLKKIEVLNKKKGDFINNIKSIENRLKIIRVDSKYKQKVTLALEKENEYKRIEKINDELKNKLSNKKLNLKNILKRHENILKSQKVENKIVEDLNIQNKTIEDRYSDYNSKILLYTEELNNINIILEKGLNNQSKKEELEKALSKIYLHKESLQKKLDKLNIDLEIHKKNLDELKEYIKRLEKLNLASLLAEDIKDGSPCPVCGSIHHLNIAKGIDLSILDGKANEREKLEKNIEDVKEKINKYSIEFMGFIKEEEHIKKQYNDILKELKGISIKDLSIDKKNKDRELNSFKENINNLKTDKEKLEKKLLENIDIKNNIDMEEIKLSENIKNETILIDELNTEFLKENDNLKKAFNEYLDIKKEINLDNIEDKLKEINEFEIEKEKIENEERKLRNLIENYDKEIISFTSKISDIDIKIGKITESGKEKSGLLQEYKEDIYKLSNEKNPYEALKYTVEKIKSISNKFDKLREILEINKKEKENIYNEYIVLSRENKILENRIKEQNNLLEKKLLENKFLDINEVKNLLLSEDNLILIEKEIDEFEDEFKNVNNNIKRINFKLNNKKIDEENWNKLKKDRIYIENLLNEKIKEVATLEKIILDLKCDLDSSKELRKKEEKLQHKLSLLNDITKLIEGNKFVEFVAMNQLKYIAREASRRLKEITRERYALEIDSECNFKVRDDFNGGEVRDTSTLSGGETFLTSLSLALALSSQVQLKGSAPLEFFFLDEGFGTLDNDLLDTVMNSLERLHTSKLSIGIISHVEELKNRVPVKLIVTPASIGDRGSTVALELS